MSVLRRNMFNRGGFAHRGTGITSGLDTPRRGLVTGPGGYAGKTEEELAKELAQEILFGLGSNEDNKDAQPTLEKEYKSALESLKGLDLFTEKRPFSKLAAASPALLKLSGELLSGTSYQGGLGGGLEILGKGISESAPFFAEAVAARRKYEAEDPEREMKMAALDMAYDSISAGSKSTQDYSAKDFKVKFKDAAGTDLSGKEGMATRHYNKRTGVTTWTLPDGTDIPGNQYLKYFDILSTEIKEDGDTTKERTPTSGTVYVFNKDWTESDPKNQKYSQANYRIDANNVTTIHDSETKEYILEKDFIEKFGEFTFKQPPDFDIKTRTPGTDTAYVQKKGWKDGDPLSEKWMQVPMKYDENNNLTFLDEKTGDYESEEDFLEKYGTFTLDKPVELESALITAGLIEDRGAAFKTRFRQLGGIGELTEAEMNLLLTTFPADYIKTTPYGTVTSELDHLLYEIIKRRKDDKDIALNEESKTSAIVNGVKVEKDAVDKYYNLDLNHPNYESIKVIYQDKYNKTPVISDNEATLIYDSIDNLKDLNMMYDNVEETIALLGKPIAWWSETFGTNEGMILFMTGKRGIVARAIEQLVRGIPSDFDAERVIAMIPKEGLSPVTNKIRIKRLREVFRDLILNKIKFAIETGKRVPADMILKAKEMGDPKEINDILRGEPNREKIEYLDNIGAGVEGFTKQGYIDEFGDPFKRSMDAINTLDVDYDGPMSKEDKLLLEQYKEKYKIQP